MALNNLSSSLIQNTYGKLVQTEGGLLADGTGSAIDSLTVTASFATVAATSLDTQDTGSLMTTGSLTGNILTFTKGDSTTFDIDLSDITVETGSFMTTGSISGATITFTKGDGSTFDIVVPDTDVTALNEFTASADSRLDSLETETGSLQTQINNINTAVGALSASAETGDILFENIYGEVYGTSTTPVTGNITISASSTKIDGATAIIYHSGSIEPTISGATVSKKTGTYDTSGAVNVITLVRDTDSKVIEYIAGAAVTSVASASYAGNADLLDNLDSSAFAQVGQNNTFTGTQTFTDIAVNGTGSFAYIQQVTGSAKVIGDAFLILNNDTPTQPYAGIKVQDSGSNTTSSLFWNANTDDWMYEYEGDDTDHGVTLFGPEFASKDSPAYPTNNEIQKGTGGHHLTGSSLTDDGAVVRSTATSGLHLEGNAPHLVLSSSTSNVFGEGPTITARGGTFLIETIVDTPVGGAGNFKLDVNRDAFITVADQFYLTTHDGNQSGDTYWTDNGTSDFQIRANSVSNSGSIWFKPSSAADAGIKVEAVRAQSSISDFSETDNDWKAWVTLGRNTTADPDPAISFQRDVEITGSLSFSGTIDGTITSASYATTASYVAGADVDGTVSDATTAETASMSSGNFEVQGQVFSPTHAGTVSSGTSSIDFDNGNFATLAMTEPTFLANPSNLKSGTTYTIILDSGSLISGHGTAFKFAGGTAPTYTNDTDVLTMVSDGTDLYATALTDFQSPS